MLRVRKKSVLGSFFLLSLVLLPYNNGNAASFGQSAQVKILKLLQASEISQMNFGTIEQPSAGEIVVAMLKPDGSLDPNSTVSEIDASGRSAGVYQLAGSPASASTVSIDVDGLNGGGEGIAISEVVAELEGNSGAGGKGDGNFTPITLGSSGYGVHPNGIGLRLGATLKVDGDAIQEGVGTYTPSFNINLSYD